MKALLVVGKINEIAFENYIGFAWGDPNCQVVISGRGGDVGYTLAMLDDIDLHKRETYATGICEDESAILATAGEGKRVCTMDALFRFFPPKTERLRDPETNKLVEKVPDRRWFLHSVCVARLAARVKCPKIEIEQLFDGQFISSLRAKELGLIDEVISTSPVEKVTTGDEQNGNSCRLSGSQESADSSGSI